MDFHLKHSIEFVVETMICDENSAKDEYRYLSRISLRLLTLYTRDGSTIECVAEITQPPKFSCPNEKNLYQKQKF